MKQNEAPERIYFSTQASHPFYGLTRKWLDDDIEYVRLDAFIEKACLFIKEHHHEFSFWNTEEYELEFSTQKFIENFKNYMKGE